jgi:hypothetical protein
MSLPWPLATSQLRHIRPHSPRSHGIPRVRDRCMVSAILFVNRAHPRRS